MIALLTARYKTRGDTYRIVAMKLNDTTKSVPNFYPGICVERISCLKLNPPLSK